MTLLAEGPPPRKALTPEQLRKRAARFYDRYGREVEQIKDLLAIKLRQLALAYTIENRLPPEAVTITARVKSLTSFLKKLARQKWPTFYYPTEVVRDLIGARIVCWFVDDCYGMLEFIKTSHHFEIVDTDHVKMRDYIKEPQIAGYRAIHVFANVTYDRVKRVDENVVVAPEHILCEVQVRTKLQDAWADITHEFFYKAKDQGIVRKDYEMFLAGLANRLALEDKEFIGFRNVYQRLADAKQKRGTREGFRDDFED
jgi:putative GTP pyrophosphokinase